jgi:hypothetical protein
MIDQSITGSCFVKGFPQLIADSLRKFQVKVSLDQAHPAAVGTTVAFTLGAFFLCHFLPPAHLGKVLFAQPQYIVASHPHYPRVIPPIAVRVTNDRRPGNHHFKLIHGNSRFSHHAQDLGSKDVLRL